MRYYKCKNIVKKFKVGYNTDEPQWAKDLEEDLKWHRITTSQDAYYTYFCCDDELDVKEAEVTDLKEIKDVFKKHFPTQYRHKDTDERLEGGILAITPEKDIKLVTTEMQVNVEKEIELKSKRINYSGCGTNWAGTYNQSISMANGDHITAAITVNDTFTWTIAAGAIIWCDGAGGLTANGRVTWVGTATSLWEIKSSLASPLRTSIGYISLVSVDTGSAVQYGKIYNCDTGALVLQVNTSSTQLTIDHLLIENCTCGLVIWTNITAVTNVASNILITDCYKAIGNYIPAATAAIFQLNDCEIRNCTDMLFSNTTTATTAQIALNNCKVTEFCYTASGCYSIMNIDNCVFNTINYVYLRYATTSTIDNSLFCNCYGIQLLFANSGNATITACDFIGIYASTSTALVQSGGTFANCYFAGGKLYLRTVYDTYVSGTSTVLGMANTVTAITNIRTTRNEAFTPGSIAESGLGDNGVTIGWTSGAGLIKTKHRIRYGTVSGTYTMCETKNYDWSNWDGLRTIMTTTPSFALVNLKEGTTYYYVVESWDWAFQVWVASAEGDFTTTSSGASITNVTINDTAITTNEEVIVTISATGTPTLIGVRINGIDFEASGSAGTYTVTIKGDKIGTGSAMSVVGYAANTSGGSASYTSAQTLTVTTSTYTNDYYLFMQDLQTLIRTEFTSYAVLIGDTTDKSTMPRIVIEPYDDNLDSEFTLGKKKDDFIVDIWVFCYHTEDEEGVKLCVDITEHLKQLLLNNKKYPSVSDDSSWSNAWPEGAINYGAVNNAGDLLRTSKSRWRFMKINTR